MRDIGSLVIVSPSTICRTQGGAREGASVLASAVGTLSGSMYHLCLAQLKLGMVQ